MLNFAKEMDTHSNGKVSGSFPLLLNSHANLGVKMVSLSGYLPSTRKTDSIIEGSFTATI